MSTPRLSCATPSQTTASFFSKGTAFFFFLRFHACAAYVARSGLTLSLTEAYDKAQTRQQDTESARWGQDESNGETFLIGHVAAGRCYYEPSWTLKLCDERPRNVALRKQCPSEDTAVQCRNLFAESRTAITERDT